MSQDALDKTIKNIVEMSSMAGGNVEGATGPFGDNETVERFNEKEKKDSKLKGEPLTEEDELVEEQLRKYIRQKISEIVKLKRETILKEEKILVAKKQTGIRITLAPMPYMRKVFDILDE